MNKTLVFIMASLVAITTLAADSAAAPRRRGPSRRPNFPPSGGVLEKPFTGKVFRILNSQNECVGPKLDELTGNVRRMLHTPIECVKADVPQDLFASADALVKMENVGAGMLVVSDPKLPIELISSDRRWGILNVAPLKADNPTPEKLWDRFSKMYWHVIARVLGAGMSSLPGCVPGTFANLSGLDALRVVRPTPDLFNRITETSEAYGLGTVSMFSYRMACQQGWAPVPTNDVQKAIWDEVHEIPSDPIKIKKQK